MEGGAMKETIICAAIHFEDNIVHHQQPKNVLTGIVVCGRRHHNVFATLTAFGIDRLQYKPATQGFVTSLDRFVDREEAWKIAFDAGQIKDESNKTLFSEDLY